MARIEDDDTDHWVGALGESPVEPHRLELNPRRGRPGVKDRVAYDPRPVGIACNDLDSQFAIQVVENGLRLHAPDRIDGKSGATNDRSGGTESRDRSSTE
jgi:hypothetical protein